MRNSNGLKMRIKISSTGQISMDATIWYVKSEELTFQAWLVNHLGLDAGGHRLDHSHS